MNMIALGTMSRQKEGLVHRRPSFCLCCCVREGAGLGLEFSFSHLVTATDLIGNAEGC